MCFPQDGFGQTSDLQIPILYVDIEVTDDNTIFVMIMRPSSKKKQGAQFLDNCCGLFFTL